MKTKSRTIQVRLSQQQHEKILQQCSQCGMTPSAFVRECLSGNTVSEMGNRREIAAKLLEMYSIVNQYPDGEGKAELLDRMDDICRFLKS